MPGNLFDTLLNGSQTRNASVSPPQLSHRVDVRGQTPRRPKAQGNAALARERAPRQNIFKVICSQVTSRFEKGVPPASARVADRAGGNGSVHEPVLRQLFMGETPKTTLSRCSTPEVQGNARIRVTSNEF